jgi:hypothetical protein
MSSVKWLTDNGVLRADVWDAGDKRCHYCGVELHPLRTFCIDHVIPRCAGGSDAMDNLVPACHPCNARKGGQDRSLCRRLRKRYGNGYTQIMQAQARHMVERLVQGRTDGDSSDG